MMPTTINDLSAMVCISAMQKCIRRGMEREAMEFAAELICSSKAFCTMACNRLEIISQEAIGLANPEAVMFTATACEQARRLWNKDRPGKALLPIGNAIRLLCRSNKSREGDHFVIAVAKKLEQGYTPEVPDFVYDHHTAQDRKQKRGLEFFRTVSTTLVPQPPKDIYEDEAYEMLELSMRQPRKNNQSLFDKDAHE